MKVFALSLLVSLCPLAALAADPTCVDQLQAEKMKVYRVDEHRDSLETKNAQLEYALYSEQQRRKALEKDVAELKKPKDAPTVAK